MQVEYGLLCDSDGRPVAIEAFEGSLKDAKTLPSQVNKLAQRFGLSQVIVVTDRGIGTKDNVTLLSDTAEFAFITALKAPQVKKLVKDGWLQLSMFDELNLAEIACEPLYRPALGRVPQPAGGRGPRSHTPRTACGHRA